MSSSEIPPPLDAETVDDLIEQWHTKYRGLMLLHDFLGWTPGEYDRYLRHGEIPDIGRPESD